MWPTAHRTQPSSAHCAASLQAGFEDPLIEVTKRLSEKAAGADTVKELLAQIRPLTSSDFHAALMDALAQVLPRCRSSLFWK